MNHDRRVTGADRSMADPDRHDATLAENTEQPFAGNEEQQQRQAGDHLGHDQRRVDVRDEDGAARKAAVAHQRESGHRSEHDRGSGRHQRDLQRGQKAVDQLGVMQDLVVPAKRKAAPQCHHLGLVERKHDQRRDRDVQERVAEREPGAAETAVHVPLPRPAPRVW